MIKFIPSTMEHIDQLVLSEVFEHKDALMYGKLNIAEGSPAISIMNDDKVIGIVGAIFLFPKVMEVYGLFSDELKKNPVAFHKGMKTLADGAFANFHVHRIQIVVKADYLEGQRWAETLGFEAECVMPKYGPNGDDYVLFGRVK
jgi:hypothetical protein